MRLLQSRFAVAQRRPHRRLGKIFAALAVVAIVTVVAGPGSASAGSAAPTTPNASVKRGIAGGYTPPQSSWPWTTLIHRPPWAPGTGCTASLIAPKRLLTASHCVFNDSGNRLVAPSNWDVYVDRRNTTTLRGEHRNVTAVVSHPGYTGESTANNDVAVMFLDRPVTDVAPAPLGTSKDWGQPSGQVCGQYRNETCYWGEAAGWGHINYDHDHPINATALQAGWFILGSDSYCSFLINGRGWNTYYPATQFCAYDYDGSTCITHGDSGGPFMVFVNGEWKLIGVASHFPSPLTWGWCQGGTNVIAETWVAGNVIRSWIASVRNPACPGAKARVTRAVQRVHKLERLNRKYYGYRRKLRKARRQLRRARVWRTEVCTG